ncbi:MAG: metallophosphoesterase, partial [Paenibacillus sp.]|nr:metallophosphoesterase [Paenibacillus sp.]
MTKLAVPVGQSPEPKPNEPGPDPEPENPQPGAGGPSGPAPGSQTGSPGGHVQTGDREVVFRAAGVKETDGQGRTVSVVGVTSRQLAEWLAGKSSMTVIVQSDSMEAVQELRVPAETLRQVYGSGSLVKLVFQNEAAAYEIRLQELLSATANEIPAGDAQIIVRMERMAGPAADGITAKLLQSGSSTVGSPVAFELSILTDAGVRKIGGLTGFGEKRMRLAAAPDTAKTVAILFDPATGTFRPLPTVFEYERGVWTAVIKHSGGGIYAVVRNDRQFADVSGHWSRSDVELLANRLIVNGVGDSTFAPDGSVTRAEFAAMLVRALGLHDAGRTVRFTDVQTSDWHAGVVLAAVQAGIVEGYENGEFRPDRQVSRQEMTVMLQRAAQYSGITPIAELPAYGQAASRFADSGSTRPWAEQAMAEA